MSYSEETSLSPPAAVERRDSSTTVDSGKDTDSFEDAVDITSVRSLTQRSLSTSNQRQITNPPDEQDKGLAAQERETTAPSSRPPTSPPPEEEEPFESTDVEDISTPQKKIPHPHRLSNASNLDNVNLDDDSAVSLPPQDDKAQVPKQQPKTISLTSLTSAFPSMPWSPPAAQESPSKSPLATSPSNPTPSLIHPTPTPATRKLTSPFSWLSRNSVTKEKDTASSLPGQSSPRRNTASSIATLTSNPEMMLSRLDEEGQDAAGGNAPARNSLKDRFKMVRQREEAVPPTPSILAEDEEDETSTGSGTLANTATKSSTLNMGVTSPGGLTTDDRDAALEKGLPSPIPPSTSLAPGTASGVSAGPSALGEADVNWDLWQAVVYEGPAAVARTSADELNKSIATGIPSAIRGVIWQVLAQSKNEELELVYKDLVARGSEGNKDRSSSGTTLSAGSSGNLTIQESITSSASSIHSEYSAANGTTSPTHGAGEKSSEVAQKAQVVAAAERKKKQKEDAAMLQKLEKMIRRDLGTRTSYSKFASSAGLQEGLFGVCKAYALFDEGVGYAQGMNFLVMPLLFNMPEEEAFCLLVRLMNHYHLRDLFIQDMPGLHLRLYQFERLLEDMEPALYCHLHRRGISPHLYATQWFLTLFAYRFPLQLVLRIYDLILSEGLSAILRFGIVLMQKNATALLAMSDMQQLTTFLKDKVFDVYIDKDPSAGSILENGFFGSSSSSIDKEVYRADQLVRDACEVKVTPELLKAYTSEWEEKTRVEKERETELEQLRNMNSSYVFKVRKLEERIEACDREQAAMATELVHTKVENEELKDENESLKGQVRELRIVIEKQPAEIEETWKLERDDLMKRNEKVHQENQRLEQELADLEEQLVQTKMQYAEINSQHETLSRRWTDLKRQFD